MQQFEHIVFTERLQHIYLAAGEQRVNHFEARVLRRRADERYRAVLDRTEQAVLLRLAETVYLVDEQDRGALVGLCGKQSAVDFRLAFGFVNHIPNLFHAARHSGQRVERPL